MFQSTVEATDAALSVVKQRWQGPIGVYPEADRPDYVQRYRDHNVETKMSPADFVTWAQGCVQQGVQIIGGCCGIELEYIQPLREALPSHLPEAA